MNLKKAIYIQIEVTNYSSYVFVSVLAPLRKVAITRGISASGLVVVKIIFICAFLFPFLT